MKILGVDPGIGRTGWGVINENSGKFDAVGFGCIETDKSEQESRRLKSIYSDIEKIIEQYNPEILAIEKLFFNKNTATALTVGQARGVVMLAGIDKGLSIEEYTPLQVKIAVVGYGRADKKQVGQMIKNSFKLKSIPSPDDTADALAIALTHASSYKIRNLA